MQTVAFTLFQIMLLIGMLLQPALLSITPRASSRRVITQTLATETPDLLCQPDASPPNPARRQIYLPLVRAAAAATADLSARLTPAQLAPVITDTADFAAAVAFLYSGTNPVQVGVAAGTIASRCAAVVRGVVLRNDGTPLPGVTVTVPGHPELGQTLSGADGKFALVVNGGGLLTFMYTRAGYVPSQRQAIPVWHKYTWLPEVALVAYDTTVATIQVGGGATQVTRGSTVRDSDGQRQATLIFPPNLQVTAQLPGMVPQVLSGTLHIRATEFTVGARGPFAMPAQLPPASGYTYAVELSVDEVPGGIATVNFSRPVILYLENFLNFPVGEVVPAGSYDRASGRWVAEPNGRVVRIVAISGGVANLDLDGDGVADDPAALAALGITNEERGRLAGLYPVGVSLWRTPVAHFSPWDLNWPYGPPPGARPPQQPPPRPPEEEDCCKQRPGIYLDGATSDGSEMLVESQSLGTHVGIVGTPFDLVYQSDRVPGRQGNYTLDISLSGAELPPGLRGIVLEVETAGQRYVQALEARPNQRATFSWDGRDAFGRTLSGAEASVTIGYRYRGVYQSPADLERSFGALSGTPYSFDTNRNEAVLYQRHRTILGMPDVQASGLGGWSLSALQIYDPGHGRLYLGGGGWRDVPDPVTRLRDSQTGLSSVGSPRIINTIAGGGQPPANTNGDGGPAIYARLSFPQAVVYAPDGSYYIADGFNSVRRVSPDGIITTVAGGSAATLPNGSDGPATQVQVTPTDLTLGPDGALYIADFGMVRRVGADGMLSTVAGTGTPAPASGDGGPARMARLDPWAIAFGPDGALYVADTGNNLVRRIGPDGIISTVAGTGDCDTTQPVDGSLALVTRICEPLALDVAGDGSIYVTSRGLAMNAYDGSDQRIYRVSPDGIATWIAGDGEPPDGFGEGVTATGARFQTGGMALGPDGSLYLADLIHDRVRRISPNGTINTVAGRRTCDPYERCFAGDGGPATEADLDLPEDVTVTPGGDLLIIAADRVRHVGPPAFIAQARDLLIPSPDGSEIYVFSSAGQHRATLQALTGALRYLFAYDNAGRLQSITDGDGNTTRIERAANGAPTAIVAPFGQRTTLTVDGRGYLASITNPSGAVQRFSYNDGGLMTGHIDARGATASFSYDSLGLLVRSTNRNGGIETLAREATVRGYRVTRTDPTGRITRYLVEHLPGGVRRTNTLPDGTQSSALLRSDGSNAVTMAEGVAITTRGAGDARWGGLLPFPLTQTIATPGGIEATFTISRSVSLTDPGDPLSLTSLVEERGWGDERSTYTYTATTRTLEERSAGGRTARVIFDEHGRTIQVHPPGLNSVSYTYDSAGRLHQATWGSGTTARTYSFRYDPAGNLSGANDPLGRTMSFAYDADGQIIRQTLAGGAVISYTYDVAGNLTSLIPPGRAAHQLAYTALGAVSSYSPPGGQATSYSYDNAGRLLGLSRPGGQSQSYTYDSAARLSTLVGPEGTTHYSYDPASGNLSLIEAPAATLDLTFDGMLLTQERWSGAVNGGVSYAYNAALRLESLAIDGGSFTNYSYDNEGRVTAAGDLVLRYDPASGYLAGATLGEVNESLTLNGFGELTRSQITRADTTLLDMQYIRDALGRITERIETIAGVTARYGYQYNTAGYLVAVSLNGQALAAYSYDANGNRLSVTSGGATQNASYDGRDRLVQAGGVSYTYDASGRLGGRGGTSYSYDSSGNLVGVSLPGGRIITYLIDGKGRRIGKRVDGVLVQGLLYAGRLRPVAEVDAEGNVVSNFIYATWGNVPVMIVKGGLSYRIITDQIGSPRLVVDASTGVVVQRLDYDAFGNVTRDTNPGFQPFGFGGGLYDRDTGLVHFGAREYDPQSGRWMSRDPLGPGSGLANFYSYAGNDPLNRRDPTGLEDEGSSFDGYVDPPKSLGDRASDWFGKAKKWFDRVETVKDVIETGEEVKETLEDTTRSDPEQASRLMKCVLKWIKKLQPVELTPTDAAQEALDRGEELMRNQRDGGSINEGVRRQLEQLDP